MNNVTLAILAHVDAGKPTTAEALLYKSGVIRTPGRVDHKDAFLDTHFIERQRGITIFSKQAVFGLPAGGRGRADDLRVFLLDTPGHADFSAETERVLYAADCALLVVSGPDGVQAHTRMLWQLLERYHVPTLVWVNKMDICSRSKEDVLNDLRVHLGEGFFDLSRAAECGSGALGAELSEELAMLSESTMEEYLSSGTLSRQAVLGLTAGRRLFPCFFGSALKMEGIDALMEGIRQFSPVPKRPDAFGARVFKITRDQQGNRLSWLKITGGELKVRDLLGDPGEKITQIRIYNGSKFTAAETAPAGSVAAVLGLSESFAGQGFGFEKDARQPLLEPVLSYRIGIEDGTDPVTAFSKLKRLQEEDPQLRIVWDEKLKEIHAQFMGRVQIEVLEQLIEDRFGIKTKIGAGRILYKETIAAPVEGVGHFEPLRHYAEVHVLMEPLPAGSGLVFETAVSTDDLDQSWQRLILGDLQGKPHVGVLTGSPLTDVRITLVAGRAHLKHTEGGDFREASKSDRSHVVL